MLRQEKLGSDAKYSGHFEIHDLTSGKGTLYVSHDYSNLQRTCIEEDVRDKQWYKYSETPRCIDEDPSQLNSHLLWQ